MKKLFLSLVAAIVAATATYAQNVYVATLNHEGTISTFYGSNALVSAHAAAVDGDIITLSAGKFTYNSNQITITKAVTIRGAGMMADTEHGIEPTSIDCSVIIAVAEKTEHLKLEGICFNWVFYGSGSLHILEDATFEKCRIKELKQYGTGSNNTNRINNCTFKNCVVSNAHIVGSGIIFENSYLHSNSIANNVTARNCFVRGQEYFRRSNFTNCIISGSAHGLEEYCSAAYCLGIGSDTFNNLGETIGCNTVDTNVFKSWDDATNSDNLSAESYELSELGLQYQGIDGTQIGMLGGNYPYNPIVSIPRITRCEVAEKATADGKLSVNIEVTAPTTE